LDTEVGGEQRISSESGSFDGDLDSGDQFGSAITSIGDLEGDGVTDLAVGAPFSDGNGRDRGAVWILYMDDDGRIDITRKISDDAAGFGGDLDNDDHFGSAVAGMGDLNGDGVSDLAVGAPMDDDGGSDRGAVWILFLNADGTVRQTQKISDQDGGFNGDLNNGDQFGGAVANIGDLDGDGVTDLAVGAQRDADGGTGTGAVWVLFMNADGTVDSEQKISRSEGKFEGKFEGKLQSDDRFGRAVAGIGDLDADGVNDLAVGADQDGDGGSSRGAVWILFMDSDGTVKSEQKISQTKGGFDGELADGDRFGSAIANIGRQERNDVRVLAVGADHSDDGGPDRGALWILFVDKGGNVDSETKISHSEGNFGGTIGDDDRFGAAVADIGDLDGDGARDIAVGAPRNNNGETHKGAVWILFMEQVKTDSAFNLSLR
jgi:hypothetical protein